MPTEAHEHAQTQKALDEITGWGRALASGESPYGGENITFAIARQGSHTILNAFLTEGDCTPFVPSGKRGTLQNQPPPQVAPIAFFITPAHAVQQVPLAMKADLNTGTVTLQGAFPEIAPTLEFRLEYLKHFDDDAGKCIVFYSDKSSDKAGYVVTFCLVAAS
jgi:hypothetical protein